MIRLAQAQDDPAVLSLLRDIPALGAAMQVDWQLWRQTPAMPGRFYLVGEKALLQLGAINPTLCGVVADGAELESFLQAQAVHQLESDGWAPAGWPRQEYLVLRRPAREAAGVPAPEGLVARPSPSAVMELLESHSPFASPAAREALYRALCSRVNHGLADVVAARDKDGGLAATAGLYALRAGEGYLSAVETRPGCEGRGYASALVGYLLAKHTGRDITLLCKPELGAFYARMGFADTGLRTCIATRPAD